MIVRNLILGLLLSNLLVLAWGQWVLPPDVEDPEAWPDAGEPELVLVSRVASRPDRVSVAAASESSRCYRLGPFESDASAGSIADRLSAEGIPVEQTAVTGQVWMGHWVQLTDRPSIGEAREVVAKLASGGLRDAYIYSRDPTIDISLGVYRSREGADDVISRARRIGFEVEATDRYRDGIEYWVKAELSGESVDLGELARSGANPAEAQIMRIEEAACVETVLVESNENGVEPDLSLESPPLEIVTPE